MGKRIGIFCHGQLGDIMTAMSVLKYKDELWGEDCKIIWYASKENWDLFKYQDIEVREFPRGFGYPEMVIEENRKLIEQGKAPIWEDFKPLVDENNHMNLELKNNYPSLADIHYGYFPAPHQVPIDKRINVEYPNVSKKVFCIPDSYEWHPVLKFSTEDIEDVEDFFNALPKAKNIAIESFGGSGQTSMTDKNIRTAMQMCRDILGRCNLIFVSHKYLRDNEIFPDDFLSQEDIFSAAHFTVRQCALVVANCELLISVSSGISVAASCWGNNVVPIVQLCGSIICSTKSLALGRFELATTEWEFYTKLDTLLNQIK